MKQASFPAFFVITVLLVSCDYNYKGNNRSRQQPSVPWASVKYDSAFFSPVNNNAGPTKSNTTAVQQATANTDSFAAQAITPTDTAAMMLAKGLNPPHGSFGHRCELDVGAPLNSKPEATPVNAGTVVKDGLNPAHGLPGHRCDIAVGAPLNSKPVTGTAQNNPAQTITTGPLNAVVKDGLNPAHGQPGHRCDIAVGAPLNPKPVPPSAPASVPSKDSSNPGEPEKPDSLKN